MGASLIGRYHPYRLSFRARTRHPKSESFMDRNQVNSDRNTTVTSPEMTTNAAYHTVSGVFVRILKKHHIRHVFGLPAAQMAMIMDGISRDPYFRYATTRHEEAAGHMAHAVHLVTGEMAMCFGTTGAGAANLVPGVAAAWADNIPMLVVTPSNQVNGIDPDFDQLQHLDHLALYRTITKWSAQIRSAERAPELIERAITIARSGRPGPVHLDIPCDVGTWKCAHDVDGIPALMPPRPVPTSKDLDSVVRLLREAERPLLLAGGGVARSGATAQLREFAALSGVPYMTSAKALGVADFTAPNHVGSCGFWGGHAVVRACAEADVILAIGCKFSTWIPIHKPPLLNLPLGQKIIQIDIDDEMLGKNVPVTMGLVGDARETLTVLNSTLASRGPFAFPASWVQDLARDRLNYLEEIDAAAETGTVANGTTNTAAFMRELTRVLPPGAIICMDGGQVSSWEMTYIRPSDPMHLAHSAGMGHMGFGIPSAIGAKIAHPDKPVITITGDGAAGLTIQELETAARCGANIVAVIFNDSAWGCYLPLEVQVFQNKRFGSTLTNVDFVRVAEGFGCYGERIDTVAQLAPALDRALRADKPTVLNVLTSFTPHPMDSYWGLATQGINLQSSA
jgi:acetolactate synthase-1/2/3 large subunit